MHLKAMDSKAVEALFVLNATIDEWLTSGWQVAEGSQWVAEGGQQVTNKWPSIGDECVMIAMSDSAWADGLLQQSVFVSFIDKSVIAKTVQFVQERSHEQKTMWKKFKFCLFSPFQQFGVVSQLQTEIKWKRGFLHSLVTQAGNPVFAVKN